MCKLQFQGRLQGLCCDLRFAFGGRCVAAEYIKVGGTDAYKTFKAQLLFEINALLSAEGLTEADALYELAGSFVNLEYTLPSGEKVKL